MGINALIIHIILGVIAYMYAKHLKITSEKGLSWGPIGYFIFIALLAEIGVLVFCYDLQKVKAKRIIERIIQLTDSVEMISENLRK